jgi:predicted MFS family arabinose efflux permease
MHHQSAVPRPSRVGAQQEFVVMSNIVESRPVTSVDGVRTGPSEPARMSMRSWLAVLAVAMGTFLVVTVENLPMGLLTAIGAGLKVSEGQLGLMVTVSGLIAAATAPVLPVLIRRLDRRIVLLGLILLMVVANLVSAAAPSYGVLLVARLFVGVSIGGFWSLAAGLGVRLVPQAYVPRATSLIFFGAMAANVLGVPAGTLLGGLTDWRVAFAALAGVALALVLGLLALLPRMPASEPVRLAALARQLRTPAVRAYSPPSCW